MSKKVDTLLGELVRENREKRNMRQAELADILGYTSPQFVSLFERGLSGIPFKTLGTICTLFEIPKEKVVKILVDDFSDNLKKQIHYEKKSK